MTTAEQFLSAQQTRAVIARDRWSRPLIEKLDGSIGAYTRSSTLGKALDEGSGLANWKAAQAVIGVASRKELVLAANAHRHDKRKIAEIVEQGMEAAGSSAAATTGTALHDLCDQYDHGEKPYVPEEFAPDVQAYLDATASLETVVAEEFAVCDELEVGGTPDRIYRLLAPLPLPNGDVLSAGTLIVGDIKTGKTLDFGHLTYSVQKAVYSRSKRYSLAAGRTRSYGRMGEIPVGDRTDWVPGEQVSQEWGVIVHVPAGKGRATVHPVDLTIGWELAQLSATVREWRKRKDIIGAAVEFVEDFHATAKAAESLEELLAAHARAVGAGAWNDVLRQAFTRRKTELTTVSEGEPA
jgi:hypothetical protein